MTRPAEIDWLYHGAGRFLPEHWARFRAGVPDADRGGNLVDAYFRLLQDPDPMVRARRAEMVRLGRRRRLTRPEHRNESPLRRPAIPHGVHTDRHALFRTRRMARRRGAPPARRSFARHPGRDDPRPFDLGGPLVTAWELAQAWPDAELVIVSTAGHSTADPGMTEAVIAATDQLLGSAHCEPGYPLPAVTPEFLSCHRVRRDVHLRFVLGDFDDARLTVELLSQLDAAVVADAVEAHRRGLPAAHAVHVDWCEVDLHSRSLGPGGECGAPSPTVGGCVAGACVGYRRGRPVRTPVLRIGRSRRPHGPHRRRPRRSRRGHTWTSPRHVLRGPTSSGSRILPRDRRMGIAAHRHLDRHRRPSVRRRQRE